MCGTAWRQQTITYLLNKISLPFPVNVKQLPVEGGVCKDAITKIWKGNTTVLTNSDTTKQEKDYCLSFIKDLFERCDDNHHIHRWYDEKHCHHFCREYFVHFSFLEKN